MEVNFLDMTSAFTGAKAQGQIGKFELANNGTLFLDEISELPIESQTTLLRVLQDHTITRIGGIKPVPIDVRIITATNKNLQEEIQKGKFRLDLFYRINVINIDIPPLRERPEDIDILTHYYLSKLAINFTFFVKVPRSERYLSSLPVPGNTELINSRKNLIY